MSNTFGVGNATSVGVNSAALTEAGVVALQITKQPVVPPSGIIQPLPPLVGFTFPSTPIPITLTGATPEGICAGVDGNIWVADLTGNVWRVTPEGVATPFALADSEPTGICSGSDGNLWVADLGGAVWRVTTAGTPTKFTAGVQPNWICAGPDGNLWVTDQGHEGVYKVTTAGDVTPVTLGGHFVLGICAGPDGNIWASTNGGNCVIRVTPEEAYTVFDVAGLSNDTSQGICAGPDGNLWFTDSGSGAGSPSVWRITPDGTGATQFTLDGTPYGICVGAGGDLWVPNTEGGFWKITTAGVTTKFTVGSGVIWVCSGPDGNLWVADQASDFIYIEPFIVRMGGLKVTGPTAPTGQTLTLTYGGTPANFPCWGIPTGFTPEGNATLGVQITVGPDGNIASGLLLDINSDAIPDGWTFPAIIFIEESTIFDILAFNGYIFGGAAGIVSWGSEGGPPQPLTISGGLNGGALFISGLPDADPHAAGQAWSNSGVLTISAG